ncbi:hypothetical protein [Roseiconus lacunae]|uniref:Uncharacterized protein n=1 Tax=Roseiconus lacunae TaxID=2605694 RepID=A0ABT7PCR1_9BACT|nr:hypothetical protein [Roseiconus lacunae]MCD0459591.1 hypothetical protein [Roseiconus lacunae]MDM4014289.1 hypothetical protein [Roseiconus lacunae]WRQ49607.1 hypothetical protein U8335_21945 [Stieleria sp. HD01]
MAKFYIWCGKTELVLNSDSAESAALAMMDRLLAPHLWVYDDPGLSERDCLEHLMLEALLHLPTEIGISEIGMGGRDAQVIPVPDTIQQWHTLMIGMQRIFTEAGLDRSVAVLAGSEWIAEATSIRRLPR